MQDDNNKRIYDTVRHIEQNLDKPLILDDLAAIACLSPFHYQRVFKEVVGESPKQFVKRLRLEEAAHRIVLNPETSILEVALSVGFQSLEAFSRAFKDYYSVSPDNFRKSDEQDKAQITASPNRGRMLFDDEDSLSVVDYGEDAPVEVKIVRQPALKYVCLQTSMESPERIVECFFDIQKWALARGIATPDTRPFGLIKDYPMFTPLDKCRYLACVTVAEQPAVSGKVQYGELPARTYAVFQMQGGIPQLVKTAAKVVHRHLPATGYKVTMDPALQIPVDDPLTTPFEENIWQVCLCVEPE